MYFLSKFLKCCITKQKERKKNKNDIVNHELLEHFFGHWSVLYTPSGGITFYERSLKSCFIIKGRFFICPKCQCECGFKTTLSTWHYDPICMSAFAGKTRSLCVIPISHRVMDWRRNHCLPHPFSVPFRLHLLLRAFPFGGADGPEVPPLLPLPSPPSNAPPRPLCATDLNYFRRTTTAISLDILMITRTLLF